MRRLWVPGLSIVFPSMVRHIKLLLRWSEYARRIYCRSTIPNSHPQPVCLPFSQTLFFRTFVTLSNTMIQQDFHILDSIFVRSFQKTRLKARQHLVYAPKGRLIKNGRLVLHNVLLWGLSVIQVTPMTMRTMTPMTMRTPAPLASWQQIQYLALPLLQQLSSQACSKSVITNTIGYYCMKHTNIKLKTQVDYRYMRSIVPGLEHVEGEVLFMKRHCVIVLPRFHFWFVILMLNFKFTLF